jgi:flagellar hook-associated protein 1 FlgK
LTNSNGNAGKPIAIGDNSLGLAPKTYFNDADLMIDVPPGASTAALGKLGLRSGFAMSAPLAEDLLVFGVSAQGLPAKVYLSGSYEQGQPAASLASDAREYTLRFDAGRYTLMDVATGTQVSSGVFNTTTRAISYGKWTVTLSGNPADNDTFTLLPNDDPLGDNRIAAALSRLQSSRNVLGSRQTVQQEYEDLVNRVGAKAVQAEVSMEAQQVVFDHAKQSRDRFAGVNLDEELADLLRFQQAYQANAQVVQVANRLFDSLLQRL